MPRVAWAEKKHNELIRLIWGQMASQQMSATQLAQRTGLDVCKLGRRKKAPGKFTVEELTKICRNLNIPIEELRSAIRY